MERLQFTKEFFQKHRYQWLDSPEKLTLIQPGFIITDSCFNRYLILEIISYVQHKLTTKVEDEWGIEHQYEIEYNRTVLSFRGRIVKVVEGPVIWSS
jgi:hypothetical protein